MGNYRPLSDGYNEKNMYSLITLYKVRSGDVLSVKQTVAYIRRYNRHALHISTNVNQCK